MEILAIICTVICVVGSAIFFANAVPALIIAKKEGKKGFFNSDLLVVSGLLTMLTIVLFMFSSIALIAERKEDMKEKPQYELIRYDLYKKVK